MRYRKWKVAGLLRWLPRQSDTLLPRLNTNSMIRSRIAAELPLHVALGAKGHAEPIFIVGAPRSGTTLLFALLRESLALNSFGQESHGAWEKLHRPHNTPTHTQIIEKEDLKGLSSRYIRGCYSLADNASLIKAR